MRTMEAANELEAPHLEVEDLVDAHMDYSIE